jgi:hypothetical protein
MMAAKPGRVGVPAVATMEAVVPQFPTQIPRRRLYLAAIAFLSVSAALTLALLVALIRQLQEAADLAMGMVLLPLLLLLVLLAECGALLYVWDALRTPAAAGTAPGRSLAPRWAQRALRPPRDVTDRPIQSTGGIVLHLEYAGLPALLLSSILDEVAHAHQDAARRIANTLVTGLLDAAVLPPDKAERLTAKLAEDQIVTIDTLSSQHSVTVVIAVGFVVLLGGADSTGKLIYEQLVQEVAAETQAAMARDVISAVRRAVHRFVSRSTERILNRADLTITAQPWREVKSRRQDRVISEAVLESGRPAVLVWPAEGYLEVGGRKLEAPRDRGRGQG